MASESKARPPFTAFSEQEARNGWATIEGTSAQWQQNIAGVPITTIEQRVAAVNAKNERPYFSNKLPNIFVGPPLDQTSQIDSSDVDFPAIRLSSQYYSEDAVGIFVEPGSTRMQQQLIRAQLLLDPDAFPYNEAHKIPRVAANAISELIEGQDRETGDPDAYTLNGLEIRHELGRSPSIVYHLIAPEGKDGLPARKVMVERSNYAEGGNISLFDSDDSDTFKKYAEQSSRDMVRVYGDEAQAAVAQDSLDLYEQIKAHGVNISPELQLLSRAEGAFALSPDVDKLLASLPLTHQLTVDFTNQVRGEAVEKVRVEREAAKRQAEERAREAAEREAREAGDRKLRTEYLASVNASQMVNIFSSDGTPVRSAVEMFREMIAKDGSGRDPEREANLWRDYLTTLVDGQLITEQSISFNVQRQSDPFDDDFGFGTRGMVSYDISTGKVKYTPENKTHGRFVKVTAGLVNDEDVIHAIDKSGNTYNDLPLPDFPDVELSSDQIQALLAGEPMPDFPAAAQPAIEEAKEERTRDFDPQAVIQVTEVMDETGRTETYNLLFNATDKQGFVVQCPSGNAYYWEFNRFDSGYMYPPGMRKPVIYLYPKKRTKAKVQVKLTDAQFTNTYPQINGDTWEVVASPNGTLTVNGKKYKYLFWDGNPTREVDWDWSQGFSVHRDNVDTFLEQKICQLGLNFAEAQDFITYWAPLMKQNEWSLVAFQTERYEELAQLLVDPKPDTLLRVYMVFKKIDGKVDLPEQKLKKMKRKGFTVVEWGGTNADELYVAENETVVDRILMHTPFSVN